MTTLTPRLNITMPPDISALLAQKAKRHNVSLSKMALALMVDAMERDEDIHFSKLAEKRETQKLVSHADAWK